MNQAKVAKMTPEQIVDELTYISYAHNRLAAEHITAEQWAKCWPNAEALEARLQAELALHKAAA